MCEYKGNRQAMYNRLEKIALRFSYKDAQSYAYDCIYGLLDRQSLPDPETYYVLGSTQGESFRRETLIRKRMLSEFLKHA